MVGPLLHNPPFVKDQYTVRLPDGRQSVRDDERRAPRDQRAHGRLQPGVITSYSIHYTKLYDYRLGTAEIESALVSHPAVTEAAAIGLPHEVKGNAIHTYVILKTGVAGDKHLETELKEHVTREFV